MFDEGEKPLVVIADWAASHASLIEQLAELDGGEITATKPKT